MRAKEVVVQYPPNDPDGEKFTVGMLQPSYKAQSDRYGDVFVPVYDSRIYDYMAYRVKRRVGKKLDNRIVLAGPPRSGKTTDAATWARRIDPDFPVEHVSFRLADFRQDLASLPDADPERGVFPIAVLDESGVDLYAKDWAKRIVKEMVKVFQIVGKKRLTMIMSLPHRNLLTKDMRDAMHFWVNTRLLHENRGFAEFREASESPWYAPYWEALFGFVSEELTGRWWNEYEKRKDEFIDKFTSLEPVTVPERIQKLLRQRNSLIRELAKRGVSYRAIEGICGVDSGNIGRIIDRSIQELEEIS